MQKTLLFLMFLLAAAPVFARGHLTAAQIERVGAYKRLIHDVDAKSQAQSVAELEKTGSPEINLQIKEAMAKTYADLVLNHHVEGRAKKEWLYSMVTLNMAYLQFAGDAESAHTAPLDQLIRQKLKSYLPAHTLERPDFHYSLE